MKIPVLESLRNKVAGLPARNLIKKRLQHRCFPVKFPTFTKFLRATILKNICERLLLYCFRQMEHERKLPCLFSPCPYWRSEDKHICTEQGRLLEIRGNSFSKKKT